MFSHSKLCEQVTCRFVLFHLYTNKHPLFQSILRYMHFETFLPELCTKGEMRIYFKSLNEIKVQWSLKYEQLENKISCLLDIFRNQKTFKNKRVKDKITKLLYF